MVALSAAPRRSVAEKCGGSTLGVCQRLNDPKNRCRYRHLPNSHPEVVADRARGKVRRTPALCSPLSVDLFNVFLDACSVFRVRLAWCSVDALAPYPTYPAGAGPEPLRCEQLNGAGTTRGAAPAECARRTGAVGSWRGAGPRHAASAGHSGPRVHVLRGWAAVRGAPAAPFAHRRSVTVRSRGLLGGLTTRCGK